MLRGSVAVAGSSIRRATFDGGKRLFRGGCSLVSKCNSRSTTTAAVSSRKPLLSSASLFDHSRASITTSWAPACELHTLASPIQPKPNASINIIEYKNNNTGLSIQEFHSTTRALSSASSPRAAPGNNKKKRKKRRHNKRLAKQKEKIKAMAAAAEERSIFQHRAHGETGRPIMTSERLNELLSLQNQQQPSSSFFTKDICNSAKQYIHNAGQKMQYTQHYEHDRVGPNHDRRFFATLRTTIDKACFPSYTAVGTEGRVDANYIYLVNTGSAPSKRQAETLAACDFIANLIEIDPNFDIRSPSVDMAKIKQSQKEGKFKANVQEAQMILEVLNASRPVFDTDETRNARGKNNGWVSNVRFFCRGAPFGAMGSEIGRSKAEAEGHALIAATARGSSLEEFIGAQKLNDLRKIIEQSPSGHVAALHVKPLPDEALDVLMNALGTYDDHVERMERHLETKRMYEREFHERRLRRQKKKEEEQLQQQNIMEDVSPFQQLKKNATIEEALAETLHAEENDLERMERQLQNNNNLYDEKAAMNQKFLDEEQSRIEKATNHPESSQGQMKLIRDALPIKAIREDLIHALKTQQVVVVSGGTGSGKSTQCPQYILEDAILNENKGSETRIVVTQPRRIAAISVAERIASERDEPLGNSVGYTVRYDAHR